MKGENGIFEKPFRYGGIMHDYEKDVEQWDMWKRCYCCGGVPRNVYSNSGTLLKRKFPYIASFRIMKGKNKGRMKFQYLCRRCAYDYHLGVIEMDGKTYFDYNDFDEIEYKSRQEDKSNDN